MVIAPPGRWSRAELAQPLPVAALAGEPMVGIAVQDALGNLLQSHLMHVDPPPRISVWVQTYQLACALVAQGAGLALVDPFTALQSGGHVVQTRPLALELDVVLHAVYRLDSQLNPLQKRFIELVRKLARQTLDLA
ncbi:LysR family transcriptional regulator OS=Rhodanobacter lindaniclasticus OX=75310 GN=B1991_08310 PE=3 SV=1 [Rhodanobacter lindaniclasticus]